MERETKNIIAEFITKNYEKIFDPLNLLYFIIILLILLSVAIALFLKKPAEDDTQKHYLHHLFIRNWHLGWITVWLLVGAIFLLFNTAKWFLLIYGYCLTFFIISGILNEKILAIWAKRIEEKNFDSKKIMMISFLAKYKEQELPLST